MNIRDDLINAVRFGNVETFKTLFASSDFSKSPDLSNRVFFLREAIKRDQKDIVRLLLTDVKINTENHDGKTLLFLAVENNKEGIVRMFLENGANLNVLDPHLNYCTPMYFAILNGSLLMVQIFLDHGVDVNASVYRTPYHTPLHVASAHNNSEMMKFLLLNNADVDYCQELGETPLFVASKNKCEEAVKLLLYHGANANIKCKDQTILSVAVQQGYGSIVEEILKYNPHINNEENQYCLKIAVQGNEVIYKNIVENLLNYGFTVNSKYLDNDFFYSAVEKDYLKIIEQCLKLGVNVNFKNKGGLTPLHCAIINYSYKQIIQLLLKYNASVNAMTETNDTPLHYSVIRGNILIIDWLLNKGAEVNIKQIAGLTALHYAAKCGDTKIVEKLLQHSAEIDARDNNGDTSLHWAVNYDHNDVVKILLQHNAEVNERNNDGVIALRIAAEKKHWEIADVLLHFGADFNSRCEAGITPLRVACMNLHFEMVQLLLDSGADINIIPVKIVFSDLFVHAEYNSVCKIRELIRKHILKFVIANLYISEEHMRFILETRESENFINFKDKCKIEIKELKSAMIINNISFYDILSNNTNRIAMYMKIQDVMDVVSNFDNHASRFPIYATMLKCKFRDGMQRKNFFEEMDKNNYLPGVFSSLSYFCLEHIILYLDNNDLRNLIKAFNRKRVTIFERG